MAQQIGEILLGTGLQPIFVMFYMIMWFSCMRYSLRADSSNKLEKGLGEAALIVNLFLPTFLLGWFAFFEHVIHRAGRFLALGGSEWEKWLSGLLHSDAIVIMADITWGSVVLLLYVLAIRQARLHGWKGYLGGPAGWVLLSVLFTIAATGVVIYARSYAGY